MNFCLSDRLMWRRNGLEQSEWRIVGIRGETRIPPSNHIKGWDYVLENCRPRENGTKEWLRVDEKDLENAIILSRKVIQEKAIPATF